MDVTQLLPGNTVNIPWLIKGEDIQNWKGVVVNTDDALVSHKKEWHFSKSSDPASDKKTKRRK